MDKKLLNDFHSHIRKQSDKDYLYSIIAFNSAASLNSIKPSTLLVLPQSQNILNSGWDEYKTELSCCFHFEFIELRRSEKSLVLLIYDEGFLSEQLQRTDIQNFLHNQGYSKTECLDSCLMQLQHRFSRGGCPDEVGVFLGYSLEDVIGFMENKGQGGLFCRYWRIYSQPQKATQTFERIDECRNEIMKKILSQPQPDEHFWKRLYAQRNTVLAS